jgi:glutaredoxin 3
MAKVIVYGAPWCPWCMKAKGFLESKKIDFEWKDVQNTGVAEEAYRKSGQAGIPVIDVDGNIVIGFDVEKIKSLLGLEE